jgi:hypothetical protein
MKTLLFFLSILLTGTTVAQKSGKSYPRVRFENLEKSTADTVRIKAYVLDIYVCPPCPKGAQCKPCIENNLTIVEEKPVNPFKVTKRLRVFTQRPDSLKVGKQYLFTIAFRDKAKSPADNATLVFFKGLQK